MHLPSLILSHYFSYYHLLSQYHINMLKRTPDRIHEGKFSLLESIQINIQICCDRNYMNTSTLITGTNHEYT